MENDHGPMSQSKHRKSSPTRQMLEDGLNHARIRRVNVTEDMLILYLEDGRGDAHGVVASTLPG